jgi:hypothetical protein
MTTEVMNLDGENCHITSITWYISFTFWIISASSLSCIGISLVDK